MQYARALVAAALPIVLSIGMPGLVFAQSVGDEHRGRDWIFRLPDQDIDLYWKRQIESNLLWMIDRVENPPVVDPQTPLVGVYVDAGVWALGAQSVVAAIEPSVGSVELLDWEGLQRKDLNRFAAIVFPGGYSYFQRLSAGDRGLDAVRAYVAGGGRYLGICAGGFLAARQVLWEGHQYPYPLGIFDGTAEGAIKEIADWPRVGAAKLSIQPAGMKLGLAAADGERIYYQGGCRFLGGSDTTTLATYFDGSPAIIRCRYGKEGDGVVILSGVHFERPTPSLSGELDEWNPPPKLSRVILPRLLGITPRPEASMNTMSFKPNRFRATVTEEMGRDEWFARQAKLRRRLGELRNAQSPVPTVLAKRGRLILHDDGSQPRGGKITSKLGDDAILRAAAGAWQRVNKSNDWRSTWTEGTGHTPVASYRGLKAGDMIVEVTFRFGPISESWQHQSFRIAVDHRPDVTGHILSAWANPNNDFIETGFLLQHIRKTRDKKIIEDLLLDHQPISIEPEVWYTATLEVVGDEALFRMGDHVAYSRAEQIRMPKNLVSLTTGTTWHEIRRVRIWHAEPNPAWQSEKSKWTTERRQFTPRVRQNPGG